MTSEKEGGILPPDQYVARHKRAFRIAFDYLNAHFPPTLDEDYWGRAAADIGEVSMANGNEPLAMELLAGVYSYLEKEYMLRRSLDEKADNRDN